MQAATAAVVDMCWIPSLMTIPPDVLRNYIMRKLSFCGLFSCTMVCKRLRQESQTILLSFRNPKAALLHKYTRCPCRLYPQLQILFSAFAHGSVGYLRWIESRFAYPVLKDHKLNLIHPCVMRAVDHENVAALEFIITCPYNKLTKNQYWMYLQHAREDDRLKVLKWFDANAKRITYREARGHDDCSSSSSSSWKQRSAAQFIVFCSF
jgi:hypothetical protein